MPNSLIFIGERPSHLEVNIKGKPDFYDAIQLSKKYSSYIFKPVLPIYPSLPIQIFQSIFVKVIPISTADNSHCS